MTQYILQHWSHKSESRTKTTRASGVEQERKKVVLTFLHKSRRAEVVLTQVMNAEKNTLAVKFSCSCAQTPTMRATVLEIKSSVVTWLTSGKIFPSGMSNWGSPRGPRVVTRAAHGNRAHFIKMIAEHLYYLNLETYNVSTNGLVARYIHECKVMKYLKKEKKCF